MSFNRLSYDSCAYSKTMQQSTDPLEYNLYRGKFESVVSCAVGNFTNNLEFGVRSEVESDLKGQTRVGSKCPSNKFPTNMVNAAPYTPPVVCHNIYNLTPTNIVKTTNTYLKDMSAYGQLN
jgi:hypothetical protein